EPEQTHADRAERAHLARPGEALATGEVSARRKDGCRSGKSAGKQITGNVRRRPDRRVDHRPAVIGAERCIGHHRLLATAATPTAAPTGVHANGRLAVRSLALHAVAGDVTLAHRRRPEMNALATAATSVKAATPTCLYIDGRSRDVTTGSGGNP